MCLLLTSKSAHAGLLIHEELGVLETPSLLVDVIELSLNKRETFELSVFPASKKTSLLMKLFKYETYLLFRVIVDDLGVFFASILDDLS